MRHKLATTLDSISRRAPISYFPSFCIDLHSFLAVLCSDTGVALLPSVCDQELTIDAIIFDYQYVQA